MHTSWVIEYSKNEHLNEKILNIVTNYLLVVTHPLDECHPKLLIVSWS